jgi:glycerophosphoryl diester phosphodiesterase
MNTKTLSNLLLTLIMLYFSNNIAAQHNIVAHRGFWNCEGSAQNSIASLQKAAEAGVYGSEFDVWLTKDGVAVVNHDATINGISIEFATFKEIKKLKLKNGERLSTLNQYLTEGKKHPETKLILELKDHIDDSNDEEAIAEVIRIVNKFGFFDDTASGNKPQIEFISFNLVMCQEFARTYPNASVSFLTSNKPPKEVKSMGVPNLDYHYSAIVNHPEWVKEAHDLGMKVNVWTINKIDLMRQMIGAGVDFITTDDPLGALELQKKE